MELRGFWWRQASAFFCGLLELRIVIVKTFAFLVSFSPLLASKFKCYCARSLSNYLKTLSVGYHLDDT
jgi:hypothetical protein